MQLAETVTEKKKKLNTNSQTDSLSGMHKCQIFSIVLFLFHYLTFQNPCEVHSTVLDFSMQKAEHVNALPLAAVQMTRCSFKLHSSAFGPHTGLSSVLIQINYR